MDVHEVAEESNNSQQQTGLYKITTGISKPRHVLVINK